MDKSKNRVAAACSLAIAALSIVVPVAADTQTDTEAISTLIATYATAVDLADTKLADQLFSDAPEVTFIHPLGEERGREQIEVHVFGSLMGVTFSERKLTPKDIAIHVYGDTAWSEFNWDFVAKVRKDGAPLHSQGRETQVYHRENGQWRIVHVHYSGVPVAGRPSGF